MTSASRPAPRKILLIRTDRVGDLVLSTPAIASFRRSWPDARIEILVNDYNEPVVRHNPDVDAVHIVPRETDKDVARQIARTLGHNADLAVALSPRTQDYVLAAWSRAPRRLGYVYRRRYLSRVAARYLLTSHAISDADPDLADRHPERPVAHEVRQVQALVTLAGGTRMTDALVLRTSESDDAFGRENVPDGAIGFNLSPRWFNENFGAAPTRAALERVAALGQPVVVTFGDDVKAQATAMRAALKAPNVRWIGGASVLQWAAVLARCSVVATVDTGATHVAAAMGVPVVVVFERRYYTLSSQEWSPWRVPSALLCKPTDGADCTALVDDIVASVDRLRSR